VKGDISGVTTVGLGAQNDVRSGGQVRLRARFLLVQPPAQRSNSIIRPSVACRMCAIQDPDARNGDELRQGSDLSFLHHPVAMGLDGALGR